MALSEEIKSFLQEEALQRFLRYVKVHTTSDETTGTHPSTERQFDLARVLEKELQELGLQNIELDEHCYLYATLPPSDGVNATPIGLLAHMDTSPAVSGENVKPFFRENYDGTPLKFPDDPELEVNLNDAPQLKDCIGDTIITASGKTLLGADDKAGIAEIMAALAAFGKYKELKHGELRICFTPDEEIGMGTDKITLEKIPEYCYTLDGGEPGELEAECFDAWGAEIKFKGISVHPGFAKNKMINAASVAARFLALLQDYETPEHTEEREGFFHLTNMSGTEEEAQAKLIIRDFDVRVNETRMEHLRKMKELFEYRYPGLKINLDFKHQYENMWVVMEKHPNSIELAEKALTLAGLEADKKPIRGGTDGARLSLMNHPTPNIFAGGLLFHSRKEWIAKSSLRKAAEVVVHLAALWAEA
ncbi:peptidase T [candidate division LCP-89 bacterium B3_LCP]|uniref:Peptidase T n=1 Tax=candidate division LCP-89 bacterium B3_LCP TaxID=2012998 RepID=A0A532UTV4_UNCL8|nr:MAG: peptidase T [candidate division LCP-89 bacterium B3_LCP]